MSLPEAPPTAQHMLPDGFCVLRTIGEGTYSIIRLARDLCSGEEVVIKVMRKWDALGRETVHRERAIMQSLNHPNILPLLGTIEEEDRLLLVLPYVRGGDLGDYLLQHGPLREEQARGVFRQLVSAVQYCHAKGIAHRDLKPENILLESRGRVKVIDFGLSVNFLQQTMDTLCGTPVYMAPEIMLGGCYGPGVDIWSLGVVLYTMVTGHRPFVPAGFGKPYPSTRFRLPHLLSSALRHLLVSMIRHDPRARVGWEEIMRHPWVTLHSEAMTPYVEPTHSCAPTQKVCVDTRVSNRPPALLTDSRGDNKAQGPDHPPKCARVPVRLDLSLVTPSAAPTGQPIPPRHPLRVFSERRCASCPPALSTSSREEDEAREPGDLSKCISLPLRLHPTVATPSPGPPPLPPNTPHTSCTGSVPSTEITPGSGDKSCPPSSQSPAAFTCSPSSQKPAASAWPPSSQRPAVSCPNSSQRPVTRCPPSSQRPAVSSPNSSQRPVTKCP
ncbi:MAP/microtubule affinity-regulating kinase 4-like, partial [Erinaceus europaeus]|uniref:non-specific serine/threonine protein kinase n=1 Tax=Erinaceus europaeus TaxID=9365 RepID=A0ABM3WEZ8_ERIEU